MSTNTSIRFHIDHPKPTDTKELVDFILGIENDEFHLGLTIEEQKDLLDIYRAYQLGGGQFWVARGARKEIIGTIGLLLLNKREAILKRMYVHQAYRGKAAGVSHVLMEVLMQHARKEGVRWIYLESSSVFKAALRFYPKFGFKQISREQMPFNYIEPRMAEYFFCKKL